MKTCHCEARSAEAISGVVGRTCKCGFACPVPVIARLYRAIQKLAQYATWIIRSSRMMTSDLYSRGVSIFPFTSPPIPLSSRRGGDKYSWGIPPVPRQRDFPLDSLYYSHCEVRSAGAISGVMGGQVCDYEIASLRSQ